MNAVIGRATRDGATEYRSGRVAAVISRTAAGHWITRGGEVEAGSPFPCRADAVRRVEAILFQPVVETRG